MLGVFERADKERALNKQYNQRRRELEQELNASRKDVNALRTTARQQLSKNNVLEAGVWSSVKTFDTAPTYRSGGSGSNGGGHQGGQSGGKGKGGGKESYGEGSGTYASVPNAVVQGIVDRATGNSTSPDSGVPEECGDAGVGGTVSQPAAGSSGGCIPAGLPGISTEENQPEAPQASDAVTSEDQRRAAGAST